MNTLLYTWNPKRYYWSDLQNAIYAINNGEVYDILWSCGNTKRINIGDIFFLMRLGEEPKGIIGCGYIISQPYPFEHWDEEKAKQGKQSSGTDLLFKALSDEPIFSLSMLKNDYPNYNWTPQSSDLFIPELIASDLFLKVQKKYKYSFTPVTNEEIRFYIEGKVKELTIKTYDRSVLARQVCIEYHGYDCVICGFNFEEVYGLIGIDYIEVHHLKQIADIGEEYRIDPINDLRPVCANCHRMLHKKRPPVSIQELLDIINSA